MKASKKGAPRPPSPPRSNPAAAARVEAARSPSPSRRVLQQGARRGVRGALRLQARGDRQASCACCAPATGCSTSAAGRARGCSTRSRSSGNTARVVGIDRDPLPQPIAGARVLQRRIFTTPDAELLGNLAAFDVVLSDMAPEHDGRARHRPGALRRRCSRRRWPVPSACWRRAAPSSGKIFQGPDIDGIRQPDDGAVLRSANHQARGVPQPRASRSISRARASTLFGVKLPPRRCGCRPVAVATLAAAVASPSSPRAAAVPGARTRSGRAAPRHTRSRSTRADRWRSSR